MQKKNLNEHGFKTLKMSSVLTNKATQQKIRDTFTQKDKDSEKFRR